MELKWKRSTPNYFNILKDMSKFVNFDIHDEMIREIIKM